MEAYIYLITNLINGKQYIGQTKRLKNRISQYEYLKQDSKDNRPIARAIKKYGWENFKFTIITPNLYILSKIGENVTDHYIDAIEAVFIKKFNTLVPNGYNIMPHSKSMPHLSLATSERLLREWQNPNTRKILEKRRKKAVEKSAELRRQGVIKPNTEAANIAARGIYEFICPNGSIITVIGLRKFADKLGCNYQDLQSRNGFNGYYQTKFIDYHQNIRYCSNCEKRLITKEKTCRDCRKYKLV